MIIVGTKSKDGDPIYGISTLKKNEDKEIQTFI